MRTKKLSELSVGICLVIVVALVLSLAILCGSAAAAKGKVIKIRYASPQPEKPCVWVQATRWFGEEFERRVEARYPNYDIQNQFLFGGAICGPGETLETVQSGIVEVGMITNVFEQSKMALQIYTWHIPFSPQDGGMVMRAAQKVIDQYPIMTDMFVNKYKQKVIGRTHNESYQIITDKPVRTLEDLKGLKIGSAPLPMPRTQALGAVGVSSNLMEAYTAIDTGVYNGMVCAPDMMCGFKLHEVAPYIVKCEFGCMDGNWLTMNLNFWNSLPAGIQKIALETGKDMELWQLDAAAKRTDWAYKKMQAEGLTVYELSKKERARWAKAVDDSRLVAKYCKKTDSIGLPCSDVVRAYIDNLEKEGYKWPVRPTVE